MDLFQSNSRSARLDQVLGDLLGRAPELQAASVVSFDGLPMASALPVGMDEDRVAAMSAALLSLGERAAENFGRGSLSQVYVEGENGTVFLVSAEDEAVLVAVGAKGAKVGLMMFEVRRSAASVAATLRADDAAEAAAAAVAPVASEPASDEPEPQGADVAPDHQPVAAPEPAVVVAPAQPLYAEVVTYPEPEVVPAAPALHVVEALEDEPEDEVAELAEVAEVVEPAVAPYSTPYAEETAAAPAPAAPVWGGPVPAEPRRDPGHWTAFDQTSH
jgi:predicted regulator of Ras-like GTPase activity (Roadblock/LC7/MglB family)